MRPALLDPLFAPAATLPGVGPKIAKLLDRLLDRPARRARRRSSVPPAACDASTAARGRKSATPQRDAIVTLEVRVVEHRPPPSARSKAPYKVLVEDETGDVELVFFLANPDWIAKRLPVGATRWVSGKLEMWDGHLQMVHPDRVMDAEALARMPAVEPVYGLTEGLYPARARQGRRGRAGAAAAICRNGSTKRRCAGCERPLRRRALRGVHNPQAPGDIDPAGRRRARGSPTTNCSPTSWRCC